ncbi:MAG: hypothetical protein MRQ09_02950 [Candidatus Midichloria sp.]|nr:hypothetical protein [Candidatus Midichloria sp.]
MVVMVILNGIVTLDMAGVSVSSAGVLVGDNKDDIIISVLALKVLI